MTFELFQKLMSFDTKGRSCIEILFSVKESEKFDYSWMGKMPNKKTKKDFFGLALHLMGIMHTIIQLLKNFHLPRFLMVNPLWKFGITL